MYYYSGFDIGSIETVARATPRGLLCESDRSQ